MRIHLECTGHLSEDIKAESVYDEGGYADHADRILAELVALGVLDPSVDVDFDAGTILIELDIHFPGETDPADALAQTTATLRTAIHAAGGMTPGWESFDLKLQSHDAELAPR